MASRMVKPGCRIAVIGTSGAGKTALSTTISSLLGLEHVELDELNFEASWRQVRVHWLSQLNTD